MEIVDEIEIFYTIERMKSIEQAIRFIKILMNLIALWLNSTKS